MSGFVFIDKYNDYGIVVNLRRCQMRLIAINPQNILISVLFALLFTTFANAQIVDAADKVHDYYAPFQIEISFSAVEVAVGSMLLDLQRELSAELRCVGSQLYNTGSQIVGYLVMCSRGGHVYSYTATTLSKGSEVVHLMYSIRP